MCFGNHEETVEEKREALENEISNLHDAIASREAALEELQSPAPVDPVPVSRN